MHAHMHMCVFPEKGPLVFSRFSKSFMIPQKLRITLVCYVLDGTESGLRILAWDMSQPLRLPWLGSPRPLTLEIPGEVGTGVWWPDSLAGR